MNLTSRPQHFNLMQLPYIWANFDAKEAVTRTKILFDAGFPETLVLSGTSQTIRFNPDFDKTTGNYLHFIVRSDSSGYVTVKYGNRDPSTVRFDLKGSGKPEHYLVRISSQEAWMHEKISAIAVSPSVPVRFEKFFIRKGD
jgi:hypothetical protein